MPREPDFRAMAAGTKAEKSWMEHLSKVARVSPLPLGACGPDLLVELSGMQAFFEVEVALGWSGPWERSQFPVGLFERRVLRAQKHDLPSVFLQSNKDQSEARLCPIPREDQLKGRVLLDGKCHGYHITHFEIISSKLTDPEKLLEVIHRAWRETR